MNAGSYKFHFNYSTLWHLFHGGTRFANVQGISIPRVVFLSDVSRWQGVIVWGWMAAHVDGAIIKCGQGVTKDTQFESNWANARAANVSRGTYWFYDSRVLPKAQAGLWWEWIRNDPGELMHFADYEESYGGPYGGWQNLKTFLDEFKRLSGGKIKAGIYTGYYYWISHSPAAAAELAYFAQYPLWLAWYSTNPASVLIPKPWTDLLFWQYGTTPPLPASEYGVQSKEMDSNNFNGTLQAYRDYFGLSGGTPAHDIAITERGITRYFNEVK